MLAKLPSIPADVFIFDMEDTIGITEIEQCIINLSETPFSKNHYIRPKLVENRVVNSELIENLILLGYHKFVLPKLESKTMWDEISQRVDLSKLEIILLVEHPRFLLELDQILVTEPPYIKAIGLGSHDYCAFAGLKHSTENLQRIRFELSWLAHAYDYLCIDTASMNVGDTESFSAECISAFEMGCLGKFVIHPSQLTVLQNASYFSQEELDWGNKAVHALSNMSNAELSAIIVEGRVLEKPHIKKLEQMKPYLEKK